MGDAVAIVIPNFNGRELLRECLAALGAENLVRGGGPELPTASSDSPIAEVVVVDNGSTDGSVEMVRTEFPAVRLVANAENRGFTPAINQGVAATTAPWVFLLNNDAIPTPGALEILWRAANDAAPNVAGIQPLLVAADDANLVDSAGIGVGRRFRTFDILMGRPATLAPKEPREIWGACAAALLVRREAFDRAGGFDEQFFVELDDVDFAFRVRWLGYTFLLEPRAIVRHYRSSSAPKHVHRKLGRVRRNGLLTVLKNYPRGQALPLVAYRAQRDLSLLHRYVRRGETRAVVRAWGEALRLWPLMRERRRRLRADAVLTDAEMRAQLAEFVRRDARGGLNVD
jgi:GT2 family glycosyltransferase